MTPKKVREHKISLDKALARLWAKTVFHFEDCFSHFGVSIVLRIFVLSLFCFIPIQSVAKSHEMQIEGLGIGAVLVYETSEGEVSTTKLIGREGENFILEIREGNSGDGNLTNITVVDRLGQRVRREASGVTFRYEPNFCYRTLGCCTFKFTNESTGNTSRVERFTTQDGSTRFSFEMYLQGRLGSQLIESGWYETGKFGAVTKYHFSGAGSSGSGRLVEIRLP